MTTTAYLIVGALVFAVGALGTLVRTSAIGRLVGIELMLAAAALTFAAAGSGFREQGGQVAAVLVLIVAAAHGAVGSTIVAGLRRAP